MEIVIQGVETCGIIADLAAEMRKQGHKVTTIADSNRYFERSYDYGLTHCLHSCRTGLPWVDRVSPLAASFLSRASRRTYGALAQRVRERICLNADLYVQVWSGWSGEYRLLKRLHEKGVRIATLFMGSEVRYYPCFQEEYGEQDWVFPDQYTSTLEAKVERLRMHERYADAIFSVPDQMGLAQRPYHHLVVPIDYKNIEFCFPDRARALVVHAPTNEGVKGSRPIESVLHQLKAEGIEFDYLPIKSVPHEVLLKILSVADVLIDEVLLHGPGWLGFEAMAAGCAVATRYLATSPAIFRPPVHPIDRRNLKEQLRLLLTDQGRRRSLAVTGRRYVEHNNGLSRVVEHIISRTMQGRGREDYTPRFAFKFDMQMSQRACPFIAP